MEHTGVFQDSLGVFIIKDKVSSKIFYKGNCNLDLAIKILKEIDTGLTRESIKALRDHSQPAVYNLQMIFAVRNNEYVIWESDRDMPNYPKLTSALRMKINRLKFCNIT